MDNIFLIATDFINLDNRRLRTTNIVSAESLFNKFLVQLPPELIQGKTILDLGSCLGAAGHWALTHGASHYTGVEIQPYYSDTSEMLLTRYWDSNKFQIVHQDITTYLNQCVQQNMTFDYVLAAGVLYGFLDVVSILKNICNISSNTVVIDSDDHSEFQPGKMGFIVISPKLMVRAEDENTQDFYRNTSASASPTAIDMIMNAHGFKSTEDRLRPVKLKNHIDPYNDLLTDHNTSIMHNSRFIRRYYKQFSTASATLEQTIMCQSTDDLVSFDQLKSQRSGAVKVQQWQFDQAVAERFPTEAKQHIPDYHRVIDLCVDIAQTQVLAHESIIDVGSALGYTLDRLHSAGFKNIYGVESSDVMIANSSHPERIVHSRTFPAGEFRMVLINWTLHFIQDKISYLESVYHGLSADGLLVLTDKTVQSDVTKRLYYKFKLDNGVTQSYIDLKEQQLQGVMLNETPEWYIQQLGRLGFRSIEIVNSRLGFVTFYCVK
jgi:2-polyprenyl-3-methyl-5-hydroxy-6-metoxy-1,4-benzoquinol methylase